MSETGPEQAAGRATKLTIAAAVALYAIATLVFKPTPSFAAARPASGYTALARGPMAKLSVEAAGQGTPATPIVDAAGKKITLASFKGHPMLVNLWATWCAPCKKEMPTLAKLQKAYGDRLKVVVVSIDTPKATGAAKAFIAANAPLAFYQEASMKIPFEFKPPAQGFPTSILYDSKGVERARIAADTDWSSREAKAVIDKLIAE
ncbi:MAG: TlpA disulfide reductase family protein [Caulobacteraceae bacterium]